MTVTEPQVDAALLNAAALVAQRLGAPAGSTARVVDPSQWSALTADLAPALVAGVEGAWEGQVTVLAPRTTAVDLPTALTAGISSMALELGPLVPSATREVEAAQAVSAAGVRAAAVFDGETLVAAMALTPRVAASATPVGAPVGGSTGFADIDPRRLHLLRDVEMGISVELGRTRMTVQDVLGLAPGVVLELDRPAGAPVDVLVNGTLMARGEVVVVDEEFAVRVTEVVGPETETRLRA